MASHAAAASKHVACDDVGAGDVGHRRPGLVVERRDTKLMPARFTTAFATTVATISPAQAVLADLRVRSALAHRTREVVDERRASVRIVGQVGRDRAPRSRSSFVYASSTASSGAVSPARPPPAPGSCFGVGSASSARSHAGLLQPLDLAARHARPARSPRPTAISSAFACAVLSASTSAATSSVIDPSSGSRSLRGQRAGGDRAHAAGS